MQFRSISIQLTIVILFITIPIHLHAQPPDCSGISLMGHYRLSSKAKVHGRFKYAVKGQIDLDSLGGVVGDYRLTTKSGRERGSFSGNYRLYADCRGYVQFETNSGAQYQVDFVTNRRRRKLRFQNEDPEAILIGVADVMPDISCSAVGKDGGKLIGGPLFTGVCATIDSPDPCRGVSDRNIAAAQADFFKELNALCSQGCMCPEGQKCMGDIAPSEAPPVVGTASRDKTHCPFPRFPVACFAVTRPFPLSAGVCSCQ